MQRGRGCLDRSVTRDQSLDVLGVRALTQQKHDAAALSGLQDDLHVQRGARIQTRRQIAARASGGASAAGRDSEPLRPMNERRWPVAERGVSLACANATRRAKSSL